MLKFDNLHESVPSIIAIFTFVLIVSGNYLGELFPCKVQQMFSESMIIITTVKGTLTIIPVVPHINPQNIKDRMLTKGLMFIEFPIHFGSIKFPIIT